MNWQAVIDHLREDANELERRLPQAASPANEIAVGGVGLTLRKLANALQMGLNKKEAEPWTLADAPWRYRQRDADPWLYSYIAPSGWAIIERNPNANPPGK